MPEHRYDIRMSESCVDPNPLMVERQDQDNFIRFQTRKRCALEISHMSLRHVSLTKFIRSSTVKELSYTTKKLKSVG